MVRSTAGTPNPLLSLGCFCTLGPLAGEYSVCWKMLKEMKCNYHQSHREKPRPQNLPRVKWTSGTSRHLGALVISRWMSSRFVSSVMYWETDWSPRCVSRTSRPSAPKVFRSMPLARLERNVSLRPPKSLIHNMIRVSLGSYFFCRRSSESKTLESEPNAYLHRSETNRPVVVSGHVAQWGLGICRWRPNCRRRRRWLAGGFGSRTCPRYECHQATLIVVSSDADWGIDIPGTARPSTSKGRKKARSTVSSKRRLRGVK